MLIRDRDLPVAGARLGSGTPLIAALSPVAAPATAKMGEALDQFDRVDVFRHLVAQLTFHPNPQRRAIGDGQGRAVEAVSHDRLRMVGIDHVNALVITDRAGQGPFDGIVTVKDDEARMTNPFSLADLCFFRTDARQHGSAKETYGAKLEKFQPGVRFEITVTMRTPL